MRAIEGIETVVGNLAPYWDTILDHFNSENERFISLTGRDHDIMGRVLKSHLVVEHYLVKFLVQQYHFNDVEDVRLTFYQKAMLLPSTLSAAAFVKPGILSLNAIRNKFGHDLNASLERHDLTAINSVLNIARQGVRFESPIEGIEAFTTVACAFLVIPPPHLQEIFMEAFSKFRINRM